MNHQNLVDQPPFPIHPGRVLQFRAGGWLRQAVRNSVAFLTVAIVLILPPVSSAEDTLTDSTNDRPDAWELRNVWSLGLEGNDHFKDQDIRQSLALDGPVLSTVRTSRPLADFDRVVAERLVDGYQKAGFWYVTVRCQRASSSDTATVFIEEGQRYTCGDLLFGDHGSVDVEAVTTALARRRKKQNGDQISSESPLWEEGEPVDFSADNISELSAAVAASLKQQQLLFADCRLEVVPHSDLPVADLRVDFVGALDHNQISQINVSGTSRHTPEEILTYLDLASNPKDSLSLRNSITETLLRSGRFVTVEVSADTPLDATQAIPLHIAVLEYDGVPKLNEPLSEAEQAAFKVAGWVADWPHHSTDIQILMEFEEPEDAESDELQAVEQMPFLTNPEAFSIAKLEAKCTLSPRQGGVITVKALNGDGDPVVNHTVTLTAEQAGVVSWNHGRKWHVDSLQGGLTQRVRFEGMPPDEEGREFRFRYDFSIHAAADQAIATEMLVNPAAFVDFLIVEQKMRIAENDGKRSLVWEAGELDVDLQTGQVRRYAGQSGSSRFEFRSAEGLLENELSDIASNADEMANSYRPDRGWSSLLAYTATELEDTLGSFEEHSAKLLLSYFRNPDSLDRIADAIDSYFDKDPFCIPPQMTADRKHTDDGVHWSLYLVNALVPPGTTPHRLGNAMVVAKQIGETRPLEHLANEIVRDERHGPLDCLLMAWLIPEVRGQMAAAAQNRLDTHHFLKDVDAILNRPCIARDVLYSSVDLIRSLDDKEIEILHAFLDDLESESEAPVAPTVKMVVHSIRNSPNKDSGQIVRELLTLAWQLNLRQHVQLILQQYAAAATSQNTIRRASLSQDSSDEEESSDESRSLTDGPEPLELDLPDPNESIFARDLQPE